MSVLIKGMKIPEYRDVFGDERGCVYLLMLTVNKDGTVLMQLNDVDGGFYRVKEIPTPHGRLIDADALENQVAEWRDCLKFQDAQILCTVIDMIHKAPTVIKAEVSE